MPNPTLPFWRLSAFYFFYFAVLGGFMPYWSLYLQNLHFDEKAIGQLLAISMLTRIVAPNFWGYLADTTGKRIELVRFGAVMISVFWLGIFFVGHSFYLMALVLFAYSFFQNAILAQFEAVTIAHLGQDRDLYGKIRLWGSVGFIATVAGFGYLFDVISIHFLPVLLLACAVIAAVFSFSVPRPAQEKKTKETHTIWHTLKKPLVFSFFIVHFLLQFSHAPYYSFYSVYLESHGYSRGVIGLLWALGVLAEVIAFTQSHRLLQKFTEYQLVLSCLLLASLRWLVIAFAVDTPALLWMVQVLHAFSFAIFHAAAMSFIYREFSQGQQGQGQAIYSALWGLGVAVGSWLAGMVWLPLGATSIFCIAAFSCWVAMIVLRLGYQEQQKTY